MKVIIAKALNAHRGPGLMLNKLMTVITTESFVNTLQQGKYRSAFPCTPVCTPVMNNIYMIRIWNDWGTSHFIQAYVYYVCINPGCILRAEQYVNVCFRRETKRGIQ